MNTFYRYRYFCACLICLVAVTGEAKEITLQHKGITLNAELDIIEGKERAENIILITHGALARRDMETLIHFRELLKKFGYSTLSINLSLGIENRHGMFDCEKKHQHRNDDAIEEIDAWVHWLKAEGTINITLLGHSRGGTQTALYVSERDSVLISSIVLLAPATAENTSAVTYIKRYKKPLAPVLNKAKQLVKAGNGHHSLGKVNLMRCRDTEITAESFVSYYAAPFRVDSPGLLRKVKKPVLVIVAGNDGIVIGLDKKVANLIDGKKFQVSVIDDADHLFRDLYVDDAVDVIHEFLSNQRF